MVKKGCAVAARPLGKVPRRVKQAVDRYLTLSRLPYTGCWGHGRARPELDRDEICRAYMALEGVFARALGEVGHFASIRSFKPELFRYKVPEMDAANNCTVIGSESKTPFDLGRALGGRTVGRAQMLHVVSALIHEISAEMVDSWAWIGAYFRRTATGQDDLVKLAYVGYLSRPIFELTDEFAKKSLNVTVGLSGSGFIVSNIRAFVMGGGPYYACDGRTRSEVCLPIFDSRGRVSGIVDAESEKLWAFNKPRINAWMIAFAMILPRAYALAA